MCKLRLDYLNFEIFKQEIDSGKIFENTPSPIFLVYLSQQSQWCLVNKEWEGLQFKLLSWVPKEISQVVSSSSQLRSLFISFSQLELNKKILAYLQLKGRDDIFFSKGGNCNGYDFLYNIYTERGLEDYFFISLSLILDWDGSESGLSKAISRHLPHYEYYSTIEELFEQWTNDLIMSMCHTHVDSLFKPKVSQHHRAIQYAFFKKHSEKKDDKVKIIYSMDEFTGSYSHSIMFDNDNKFRQIARAKSEFLPQFLIKRDSVTTITLKNNRGRFIQISLKELNVNNEPYLKVQDIESNYHIVDKRELNKALEFLGTSGRYCDDIDISKKQFITKPRMLEQLKYLTRLPAGIYIDVAKQCHATTFHMLTDGKIVFYDSNATSPPVAFSGYEKLYQLILEKHSDGSSSKHYPESYSARLQHQFKHTAYHFNSSSVKKAMREFSLFSIDELPRSLAQVKTFRDNSANGYTHLHLAVMYYDFTTLNYLLENKLWDVTTKDIYGLTALDLAIRSGNLKAALLLLDNIEVSQFINSDFIEQVFSRGQSQGMMALLNHSKAIVNIDSFTQSAMKHHCLNIVSDLLDGKRINPNDYIQQALLSNDIKLIELLIKHGANINITDEFGNTALHYSIYMLNSICFNYLIQQPDIDIHIKNQQHLTPIDVAKSHAEQKAITKEMQTCLESKSRDTQPQIY